MPLDTLIANLFEHCHEHWLLHALHVKWAVTTVFIRAGFWLTTGSSAGWDQWVGHVEQAPLIHWLLVNLLINEEWVGHVEQAPLIH